MPGPLAQSRSSAPALPPDGMMNALVLTAPKQFSIQRVRTPTPGAGEVLCRVRAVAICGTDPKVIDGLIPGWPPHYPFIAGHEWSGEVVALGPRVTEFAVGDRVVGEPHKGCARCSQCLSGHYNLCENYGRREAGHSHYGFTAQGAYAEYAVWAVPSLHHLPDAVSHVHASMVDSAGVALHGLRLAHVEPGSVSLVVGPGAIGLCAIQLLKALGATRVIAVGRRGARLETTREVGADNVVDVLSDDPVGQVLALTGGRGVDISVEASGAPDAPALASKTTRFGGKILLLGFYVPKEVTVPLGDVVFKEQTVLGARADPNIYSQVLRYMATGQLRVESLISHTFPLRDFAAALDTFVHRREGALKVVIEP